LLTRIPIPKEEIGAFMEKAAPVASRYGTKIVFEESVEAG
jgi:hypothetical protein